MHPQKKGTGDLQPAIFVQDCTELSPSYSHCGGCQFWDCHKGGYFGFLPEGSGDASTARVATARVLASTPPPPTPKSPTEVALRYQPRAETQAKPQAPKQAKQRAKPQPRPRSSSRATAADRAYYSCCYAHGVVPNCRDCGSVGSTNNGSNQCRGCLADPQAQGLGSVCAVCGVCPGQGGQQHRVCERMEIHM